MDEERKITIPLGEWKACVEKAARLDERRELDEKIAKMIEVIKPLLPQLFPGAFPQPMPQPTATFSSGGSSMPVPAAPYIDPFEELKKALVEIKDEIAGLKPKEEPPKLDEKGANEKVGKVLRSLEKP